MTSAGDGAVVIALGSNLEGLAGAPDAMLEAALAALPAHGLTATRRSRWWRSAAWPDPTQPAFVNGVALIETTLPPLEVLAALLAVERRLGRVRGLAKAPRTLDLDLIAYGRRIVATPALTLPHPRAHERRFVMGPLAEIAPDWRHPVSGDTAAALAAVAAVGRDAEPDSRSPSS